MGTSDGGRAMKTFWAQLRREVADSALLWAAGVVAGLVPLLLPILYSAEGQVAIDLRIASAVVGGGLLALSSLALLGDRLLARDVDEGRFGFYLARPLPTSSLWAARLTAAILVFGLLVVAVWAPTWLAMELDGTVGAADPTTPLSAVAVTAPGATFDGLLGPLEGGSFFRALGFFGLGGLILSLLLLSHTVSTSARSRSPWTLLDVAGFVVVSMALLSARDILLSSLALGALVVAERLFVMALATILVAAGYRQAEVGRSDLASGHGVFSRTVWPLLALVVLGLVAWAGWVASPEADDLVSAEELWLSTDGRQVAVEGEAAHRLGMRTGVLFSTPEDPSADDAVQRRVVGRVTTIAAARHGGRLAWVRCRRFAPLDCRVWTWRPGGGEPAATGIEIDRWDHDLAISPFGELVAVAGQRLEIWEPDAPRLVFALDRHAYRATFVAANRLLFLHYDPDRGFTSIDEVDLDTRTVRGLAELPGDTYLHRFHLSPSGRLVALGAFLPPSFRLLDTRTGAVLDLRESRLDEGETLRVARFVGEELWALVAGPAGTDPPGRLLRVAVADPAAGDPGSGDWRTDVLPLPELLTMEGSRAQPFAGGLLVSVPERDGPTLDRGRVALPPGVEPEAGQATYFIEAAGDELRWHKVAQGVRLPGEIRRLASDPVDAPGSGALLLAGGGAVVQLRDGRLHRVVPALPETADDGG